MLAYISSILLRYIFKYQITKTYNKKTFTNNKKRKKTIQKRAVCYYTQQQKRVAPYSSTAENSVLQKRAVSYPSTDESSVLPINKRE